MKALKVNKYYALGVATGGVGVANFLEGFSVGSDVLTVWAHDLVQHTGLTGGVADAVNSAWSMFTPDHAVIESLPASYQVLLGVASLALIEVGKLLFKAAGSAFEKVDLTRRL